MSERDDEIPDARVLIARVRELRDRRAYREAIQCCNQLNEKYPGLALGWHTTGSLALQLDNPLIALGCAEKAAVLEPDEPEWALQVLAALLALNRVAQARSRAEQVRIAALHDARRCTELGLLLQRMQLPLRARDCYARALVLEPDVAEHHYNLAATCRFLGELDKSEDHLDRAILMDPGLADAYWLRAGLRRQTPDRNHVEALQARLRLGGDPGVLVPLHYALAKELDDLGRFAESYEALSTGATLRSGQNRYDAARELGVLHAIRQHFDCAFRDRTRTGVRGCAPVFVLGLPRSGSTLVERILCQSGEIDSAGEIALFGTELHRLARSAVRGNASSVFELVRASAGIDFAELGRKYIDAVKGVLGHDGRFVDKLPLNYLHIGAIRAALPDARIVCMRRNPMDSCFAMYRTLFAPGAYPFSYSLTQLGQYFAGWHALIGHWQDLYGDEVHMVDYEQLVMDPVPVTRALFAYCGLQWSPTCLTFHNGGGMVTTASASQVREPIYTSSVNAWRRYERQLQPLSAALSQLHSP